MEDWKTETFGYNWLRKQAADRPHMDSAMAFLQAVGVVPADVEYRRRTRVVSNSLSPEAIPALYLAEFANDWDAIGPSSPDYFVAALEFECAGSTKQDVVSETLSELGALLARDVMAVAA